MGLDSNYGDQLVDLGDTINLNVTGVWSNEVSTSYGAINLPSGLSISNVGVITGDIAIGGVIGTTITVDDISGTKRSAGFNWYVSTP